jgi:hypothetical protein
MMSNLCEQMESTILAAGIEMEACVYHRYLWRLPARVEPIRAKNVSEYGQPPLDGFSP